MADMWQAAEARNRFSDLVDAAVDGRPQFVRRRDGREVVVVSKEYFEETKPNLKSYLASSAYPDSRDDAFDVAIRGVRRDDILLFDPKSFDPEDWFVYFLAHRVAGFDLRRAALRVLASIEIEELPHVRAYHSRVRSVFAAIVRMTLNIRHLARIAERLDVCLFARPAATLAVGARRDFRCRRRGAPATCLSERLDRQPYGADRRRLLCPGQSPHLDGRGGVGADRISECWL
jgi:prevent-host-death family protein